MQQVNRYKFAFNNGNFYSKVDIDEGNFTSQFMESALDQDTSIPANKFDCEFKSYDDWYWSEIPTPILDHILDYQKFDEEQKEFLYAAIGRMLFPLGELDNWGFGVALIGIAGTGKSLILDHIVQHFFRPQNCIIFDGGDTVDFAQELLAKSQPFMIVAPELMGTPDGIGDIIDGDQHSFQANPIGTIAFTNQNHFMMTSNQQPHHSLDRHLAVFQFNHRVKSHDKDVDLHRKLRAELPAILQKSVRAYHEMVANYNRNVDPVPSSLRLGHDLPKPPILIPAEEESFGGFLSWVRSFFF
jgi:hypothetical protein